ncbi:MAG: translation initiation factor IF-3 [Candidatus Westeberhardia cardiocondylae]|nr:translation initiation factor IF-3 [Candidatus Westeberhardia cardiocondylae]
MKRAEEIGVDLVEISSNSIPPVCRIMNYGKFLYKKNKILKIQKKKQKIIQIKEVKFRPNTDESDYQIKLKNIIRFLENGDKVKITVRFRGREIMHYKIGIKIMYRIRDKLINFANIESMSKKIEGRQIVMTIFKKNKKIK